MPSLPSNDYGRGSPDGAGTSASSGRKSEKYWDVGKLKRAYLDYLGTKREEIEEQQESRRLTHGAHWTEEQLRVLKARKQPVVTYNRIVRKINGVVGLMERIRQDPKGFPRTPQHEEGAELATAVLRYVMDQQDWDAKHPLCARMACIDGIAGVEINLEEGDQGDPEIAFDVVDTEGFFYDPRSMREDFSDARYMGMGKWVDIDTAIEMFPDHEEELEGMSEEGMDLSTNSDREQKWFYSDGTGKRRLRLVECWYKHKGKWCYSIFTGSGVLMEGESYLYNEKNQPECKYVMFSCDVDHDGDRYGFVRNLKSANLEINARRSRALHELATKRLIMTQSAVQDIETARREWAKPDGVIVVNSGQNVNEQVKTDDKSADLAGQVAFLEDAKAEIENFGPNPALIGQGIENKSGRAIALLQQAGMAELGPFIAAYKGWKIRVYRAIWSAVQRHWTAERWIRVTDDQQIAQFVQVNGVGLGPDGMPTVVNALGSLDVDIIIDEAPDQITTAQETFENLSLLLPNVAPMLGPAEAKVVLELMVETSALPGSAKKKFRDGMEQAAQAAAQPNPAQEIALAGEQAKVEETQSKTMLNMAKARSEGMPEAPAMQMQEQELPMDLQAAEVMAGIEETMANIALKQAQTYKTEQDARLMPMKMAQDASNRAADRQMRQEQFQKQAQMKSQQAKKAS